MTIPKMTKIINWARTVFSKDARHAPFTKLSLIECIMEEIDDIKADEWEIIKYRAQIEALSRKHVCTCKPDDDIFFRENRSLLNVAAHIKTMLTEGINEIENMLENIIDTLPPNADIQDVHRDFNIGNTIETFPLNLACTTSTIGAKLNISKRAVEKRLVSVHGCRDIAEVSNVLKMEYPEWRTKYSLESENFLNSGCIVYISIGGMFCYMIKTVRRPNWQFVASKDVQYLERIS